MDVGQSKRLKIYKANSITTRLPRAVLQLDGIRRERRAEVSNPSEVGHFAFVFCSLAIEETHLLVGDWSRSHERGLHLVRRQDA